jgi:hypothetical protein
MMVVLSLAFTFAWAQNDLNLTFEDDSDVANWANHDETNVWTAVAHDATAGVGGSGALVFTDAGWDFLIKRPVTATLGADYVLTVTVKNPNFTGQTLYLSVQGLGNDEPSVGLVSESDEFLTYMVAGTADTSATGYIRFFGNGGGDAKTVTIDNLVFDDDVTYPETVNVTFLMNTAGVPDILTDSSSVQARGDTSPLTWDGGSGVIFENIGGDYWQATAAFPGGARVNYKMFTNATPGIAAGVEFEHAGWEGDLATGNRVLDLRGFFGADTTLPLQFVNGFLNGMDQFATPYTTNDSTFAFHVRVNMAGWEDFSSDAHVVAIRGSNMSDWGQTGELSWGPSYQINMEQPHPNGGSQIYDASNFYSGTVHVPNTYATAGIAFKFVVHNAGADLGEDWGQMAYNSNIQYEIPTTGVDTTIYWQWFDGLMPAGFTGSDTVDLTFNADLTKAIANNGFSIGDSILVRAGYFGTANEVFSMGLTRQGFSNVYSVTIPDMVVDLNNETGLYYQYYKVAEGAEYREVYFNFEYDGNNNSEAERRNVVVAADGQIIDDIVDSNVDPHRQPVFQNTGVLSQDVEVTYTLDLRPAYWHVYHGKVLEDIQGGLTITTHDQIDDLGVFMNGPATGGWTGWGGDLSNAMEKELHDDGTHGDMLADDSIYAVIFTYGPDSTNNTIGQEFKFGIGGGDNESGYGLNHIENIDDGQATFTLDNSWGSINPVFYEWWNYDTGTPIMPTSTDDVIGPYTFALKQNYPNPFNPTTSIEFTVGSAAKVDLVIYNALGQEVRHLVNSDITPGAYTVSWNGLDNAGQQVPSGLYVYRITNGTQTISKKMLMLK